VGGETALAAVHSALLEATASIFRARGVPPSGIAPPRQMVVGVWARPSDHNELPTGPTAGYTAPTKVYYVPGTYK